MLSIVTHAVTTILLAMVKHADIFSLALQNICVFQI